MASDVPWFIPLREIIQFGHPSVSISKKIKILHRRIFFQFQKPKVGFCGIGGNQQMVIHFSNGGALFACPGPKALWALLVWLLMLFGRFTGFAFNSWMEGEWTMKTLPFVATYSLSTGILVVASFWQFRTSHAMLLIVNSWSASVLRGEESCIHSKHETQRQFWQNL